MLAGMWYSPAVLSGNQFVSRPPPQCNFWIHPWNGKIRAEVSCPPKNLPSPTPMNAAQGSHSAVPMGRGKQAWGTLPKVPMPKHPPELDDRRMR